MICEIMAIAATMPVFKKQPGSSIKNVDFQVVFHFCDCLCTLEAVYGSELGSQVTYIRRGINWSSGNPLAEFL